MTPRPVCAVAALILAPTLVVAAAVGGGPFDAPNTFQSGTKARANEVNENFAAVSSHLAAFDARLCEVEPANVVLVATEGGDASSIADALAGITDSSEDERYLVRVAPGVYEEATQLVVPPFVRVAGAGPDVTVVRASVQAATSSPESAVVVLDPASSLADLTIENTATDQISTGVYVELATPQTAVDNVRVRVEGVGGIGHIAFLSREGDPTLTRCDLVASGANISNIVFASTDSSGPFARPTLVDCSLRAEGNGSFGIQALSTAARVAGCHVFGGENAIRASDAGIQQVRDSVMETSALNPVYQATGSAAVLSAGTHFIGGTPTGLPTSFKYVWCFKANFDPVANGFGSAL